MVPVLRQVATPWTAEDGDIAPLIARLHATLLSSGGVGIAAPQIGVGKRVFGQARHASPCLRNLQEGAVYRRLRQPAGDLRLARTARDYEACLSVTGIGGRLPRAFTCACATFPRRAARPPREVEAHDWDARIFQHELDHIDGHLYIDHLAALSRAPLSIEEMRLHRDAGHRERGLVAP